MAERTVALVLAGLVIDHARTVLIAAALMLALVHLAVQCWAPFWWARRVHGFYRGRLAMTQANLARLRDKRDRWRQTAIATQAMIRRHERAGADGPAFADLYRLGLAGARWPAGRAIWLPAPDEACLDGRGLDEVRWFEWYVYLLDAAGLGVVEAARTATVRVFDVDPRVAA